mgnify:CR=1 FL=1
MRTPTSRMINVKKRQNRVSEHTSFEIRRALAFCGLYPDFPTNTIGTSSVAARSPVLLDPSRLVPSPVLLLRADKRRRDFRRQHLDELGASGSDFSRVTIRTSVPSLRNCVRMKAISVMTHPDTRSSRNLVNTCPASPSTSTSISVHDASNHSQTYVEHATSSLLLHVTTHRGT